MIQNIRSVNVSESRLRAVPLERKKYITNFPTITAQKSTSDTSITLEKSLNKISIRTVTLPKKSLLSFQHQQRVKLPHIKPSLLNPEDSTTSDNPNSKSSNTYYQSALHTCFKKHETTYMMTLYRDHFYQFVDVLRAGCTVKPTHLHKEIILPRKNTFKTIFLDLDETLVHCDERAHNCPVKLNFPLENGTYLTAGVRIRPFCQQFLQQLAQIAEIIIFTASSASYADVILNYLDPDNTLISHRLYRQHCTLEKGLYLKDLRRINRRLQDVVLVDNSPQCHLLQPECAVPIVPYFHFVHDRELEKLLPFLKTVIAAEDTRTVIRSTFFWEKYVHDIGDSKRIFLKHYQEE